MTYIKLGSHVHALENGTDGSYQFSVFWYEGSFDSSVTECFKGSPPRVHIYRIIPSVMTQLRLTCDDASTFKNAVRVFTLDGAMVGHVAAEHVKLVSSWINFNDYNVFILPYRIQCLPSKT